jgi:hypothetical protein
MFRPLFREMFDSLWINFEPLTRPKAERVESLTLDVPLSFRQAFAGIPAIFQKVLSSDPA